MCLRRVLPYVLGPYRIGALTLLHRVITLSAVFNLLFSSCATERPKFSLPTLDEFGFRLEPAETANGFSVGVLDGSPEYVFGNIQGVALLSGETVAVLDNQYNNVRLFDGEGVTRGGFGTRGGGPGEFLAPIAIEALSSGNLVTLDSWQRRLTQFAFNGQTWSVVNEYAVPFDATNLCAFNDSLFVMGLYKERIVHVYTVDGTLHRSFGEPVGPEHAMLRSRLTTGQILCHRPHNLVVVVPKLFNQITAYNANGSVLWTTALRDFEQVVMSATDEHSFSFGAPRGWHHLVRHVASVDDSTIAVQLSVAAAPELEIPPGYETRFLNVLTGVEIGRQSALPWLGLRWDADRLTIHEEPFGRIERRMYVTVQ